MLIVYLADFFSLLVWKTSRTTSASPESVRLHHSTGQPSLGFVSAGKSLNASASVPGSDAYHAMDQSHNERKTYSGQEEGHVLVVGNEEHGQTSQADQDASAKFNAESSGELPKHPMNRNMIELQAPGRTGLLSLDTVKQYYRKLAKAYLETFNSGIHRQMFFDILRRRTYSLTPPGANKGVQTILFQIIDKRVYMMDPYEVPRNSKPFYRTRINEVIWLLSQLAGEGRIKDTEFLIAIHDCVQTVNKDHSYRGAHFSESNPAFTIVSCNFSDNIPFPMWEGSKHRDGGFSGWDDTIKRYAEDDVPWEKKQERAVFRGGNRPSMYFRNKTDADQHCHDVGRTRLLYLSQQQPDVLDVSIGGTCAGVHTQLQRLEPKEHHNYKYILYAEGNCMWADRSRHQLFGPSLLIKQETPCGQFFEPLLRPHTHYVPTNFFFGDTIDQITWARQNDEKVREIVRNANEFGKNFLSLKGIETYVEVLLEEYTALLVEPEIKLENGAVDVTNKQV